MLELLKVILLSIKNTPILFFEWKKPFFIATLCTLLFFSFTSYSFSDEKKLEYEVKAAYLYNFTKFIRWPDDVLTDSVDESLNICILGRDSFGRAINILSNKKAQGHNIDVVYIKEINSKASLQCHIIFIAKPKVKELTHILSRLSNSKILTVSDIDGFAESGGGIALNIIKGKVRFTVNLKATKNADLKVSAKLLELATMVIR